ncbi:hypothetical protein ABGV42_01800 [Paenibacillus pabuli]|uniref:hypothetical protein n=1 Tax=Paenibacillus pabuli TaxID=1472 RepID=UPI0032428A75
MEPIHLYFDEEQKSGVRLDDVGESIQVSLYDWHIIGFHINYGNYKSASDALYRAYDMYKKYADVVGFPGIYDYIHNTLLHIDGRIERPYTLIESHLQSFTVKDEVSRIFVIDAHGKHYWYQLTGEYNPIGINLSHQGLSTYAEYIYTENGWQMGVYSNPELIEKAMKSGTIFEYLDVQRD